MVQAIRQGDIPGVQLRCERRFAVAPEELWEWLTRTDRLSRWLADEVELGEDRLRLETADCEGARLSERGVIVEFLESRRWRLDFQRLEAGWEDSTELRLEISAGDPCLLTIVQSGFQRLSLSRCLTDWEFYRRRWRRSLERLAGALGEDSAA